MCGLAPILITFNKKELTFLFLALSVFGDGFFLTNALYAMLNSFVFLLVAAAISLLVSLFPLGNSTINLISNIVGLGMGFTCGIFVSQDLLPESALKIAHFLPAYWYVRANNMLGDFPRKHLICHSTGWHWVSRYSLQQQSSRWH